MICVNISSTNFNKSMNNAYAQPANVVVEEVPAEHRSLKNDYLANLDDSSDEEEINQAIETFKNTTRMQIRDVFKQENFIEGKSVLLHSLGRIYFNVPFNNEYQELKSKFFKKAKIPPEKREILSNYKVEPNHSNRENRKQRE